MKISTSKGTRTVAEETFRRLMEISKELSAKGEHRMACDVGNAAHIINSLDVLIHQSLQACKRIGFEYDPTLKEGEFAQAFFWLQEKGQDAYNSRMADTKYLFYKGVEEKITDLFNYFKENKDV